MSMNKKNTEKVMKNMKIIMKKTGKKKTVKKPVGYHDPSDQPVVTPPRIDKLSVLVDIHDPALHGQIVHEMLCILEQKTMGFVRGKSNARYPLSVSILCPDANGELHKDSPLILFQATSKENPARQVRLEFNPQKLFGVEYNVGTATKNHLDEVFLGLWGSGFFEFLCHGRISRIDVCRDIQDRSPEDYFFNKAYAQASHSFASNGKLATLYLGKRDSHGQVVVYNKSKQMSGKDANGNTIRVEARLKPKKKMNMSELAGLENPFKRMYIYSLLAKNPPGSPGYWPAFQDACRFRGISKAIKRQPASIQQKLKKLVQQSSVPWWKMDDDAWTEAWDQALKASLMDTIPTTAQPLDLKKICGE